MIVFVAFETEFFSFGGLGAVMKWLPREMGGSRCAVMAPFFRNLIRLDQLQASGAAARVTPLLTFHVLIRGQAHAVEIIEAVNRQGLPTYFLSSPEFFNAPENPYVNPCDPARPLEPNRNPINGERLTEDALFFSMAVPTAVVELAKEGRLKGPHVTLHLQDWETASVALAMQHIHTEPALKSVRCVLTLHNPYDKPLHPLNSPRVCDLAAAIGLELDQSILEQSIPALDAPVATVSAHFAHELRNEALYTQVFCPHLQQAFKERGLVGIDNGVFGEVAYPFSARALAEAKQGRFAALQAEKWQRRIELGAVLKDYLQPRHGAKPLPAWGGPLDLDDPAVPVFLLLGRDDPRQKGFDVAAEAIRSVPRGAARYLFAVMPGDEGLAGLAFLRQLAEERPGEVCVLPFRIEKAVFQAMQRGCSYLVMASMYEPFGAASEGYLAGMPVVARATGGLVQQVAPHPVCLEQEEVLSLYGRQIVRKYHAARAPATGILFRERISFADEAEGWREIVDCDYWEHNPRGDRVDGRKSILLVKRMTRSAAAALRLAVRLYADQPAYAAMIHNGWSLLPRFQWQRSVKEYSRHLFGRRKPLKPRARRRKP